jgi:glycerophosphoryl diester phosphodiesterase
MTLVYAHRGDSAAYPENTLLAFRRAMDSGAYGIELDLHATSDGTVVVIHDRSLERTTTGRGYVDEQTLPEVREADAGAGERVPTFAEVLDLVGDRLHFDLEVKQPGVEAGVLEVLAAFPAARWAISSFDWEILRRLRELAPEAELWPLAMHVNPALLDIASNLSSPCVAVAAGAYTAASAQVLSEAGLAAMVWTVNQPDEALRVRALGAAAMCTDVPGEMVALFAKAD